MSPGSPSSPGMSPGGIKRASSAGARNIFGMERAPAGRRTPSHTPTASPLQQHRDVAMVKASSTPRLPYRNVREQSPTGQATPRWMCSPRARQEEFEREKRAHEERLRRLEAETREARQRIHQRLQAVEEQQAYARQLQKQAAGAEKEPPPSPLKPKREVAQAPKTPELAKRKPCNLAWLLMKLDGKNKEKQGRGSRDSDQKSQASDSEEAEILLEEIQKEKKVGAGSFGAVWKAKCRGRDVAVKYCQVGKPSEVKMIEEEISYLRKLRHPRLVSFLGFAKDAGQVIIVMEFMSGGSLSHILFTKKVTLSFDRKCVMAHQMAEGLAFLHDLSVVHRDLKTANVILDDDLNCKICDFGLTITLDRTHMTVWGLQGSPRYMAPEQLDASDHKPTRITEKVDIWQMGCVLMELYCHTLPFANLSSVASIITELVVKRRGPAIPEKTDPRARVLIGACLRLSPKVRPSADMLLEAIGGICPEASSSQEAGQV